jgi:hypothetical protein
MHYFGKKIRKVIYSLLIMHSFSWQEKKNVFDIIENESDYEIMIKMTVFQKGKR